MGGSSSAWAERVLQLLSRMNSFHMQGSSKALCRPFYVASHEVGVVQPRLFPLLSRYPEVFHVSDGAQGRVELSSRLCTYEQRSGAIERTLTDWRQEELFSCLRSWRNEGYLGSRATACTSTVTSVTETACPCGSGGEPTTRRLSPEGWITCYTYEDEWGVFPECQFVYDLEVPVDFVPKVGDGEVLEFYLWPLEQVREAIAGSDFKPNCAMVVLDFLIRHGTLDADDVPDQLCLVKHGRCGFPCSGVTIFRQAPTPSEPCRPTPPSSLPRQKKNWRFSGAFHLTSLHTARSHKH
ncbi:thiamin pyrophosphokinase 2 isoform X4 [Heterodontus francisci]|uniref:thiamin pyrophosphokinase 2 isoform X4 n=1 Tax=Heterodontus francisci TaxID=7792 RepID=UPI00355B1ED8